ncbi:unnamed protein product [Blepharisma stoltei]|uniref:protein disulfide-isomerase n=1 Tax=Blepharisma stoltei TaxID=1481888 RepID=A0AAU9JL49_9CILI|nr:unnamed protein product [Blepharisma stoltei]
MGLTWLLSLPALLVAASYFDSPYVEVLSRNNFDEEVLKSTDIWFINFISANDQKSQRLAPKWNKAAEEYKGKVRFGIVDMTDDQSIGSRYGVTYYPTIKFFGIDKSQPPNNYYPGKKFEDNMKEAYRFAISQIEKLSIENKPQPPSEPPKIQEKANLQNSNQKPEQIIKKNVEVPKDDNTFNNAKPGQIENNMWIYNDKQIEEVLQSEQMWLICFYKSYGEVSQKLNAQLPRIAAFFKDQVNVAKVDAELNPQYVLKNKITQFPSLKLLKKNFEFEINSIIPGEIITIVQDKYDESKYQPKIPQIVSQSQFETSCRESICMIAFIPNLRNSDLEDRFDFIDILYDLSTRERAHSMNFLWAEQDQFSELEAVLGISSFPTLVSIGLKKSKFAVMKSPLNKIDAIDFYSKVLRGGVPLKKYISLPLIPTTDVWHISFESKRNEKNHD